MNGNLVPNCICRLKREYEETQHAHIACCYLRKLAKLAIFYLLRNNNKSPYISKFMTSPSAALARSQVRISVVPGPVYLIALALARMTRVISWKDI